MVKDAIHNPQNPIGIKIFAWLIILSSLGQMMTLGDFAHYQYLFQDLPDHLIPKRYALSWCLRIAGLLAGIGILYFWEIARKIVILIFVVTIAGVNIKVSPDCFAGLVELLERDCAYLINTPAPFSSVVDASVLWGRIIEAAVAAVFI